MAKVLPLTEDNWKKIKRKGFTQEAKKELFEVLSKDNSLILPDGKPGVFVYEPMKCLLLTYSYKSKSWGGSAIFIRLCSNDEDNPKRLLSHKWGYAVSSETYLESEKTEMALASNKARTFVKRMGVEYFSPKMTIDDKADIEMAMRSFKF